MAPGSPVSWSFPFQRGKPSGFPARPGNINQPGFLFGKRKPVNQGGLDKVLLLFINLHFPSFITTATGHTPLMAQRKVDSTATARLKHHGCRSVKDNAGSSVTIVAYLYIGKPYPLQSGTHGLPKSLLGANRLARENTGEIPLSLLPGQFFPVLKTGSTKRFQPLPVFTPVRFLPIVYPPTLFLFSGPFGETL